MPIIMNMAILCSTFLTLWNRIEYKNRFSNFLGGIFKYTEKILILLIPFLAGTACFLYFTYSYPKAQDDARTMIMIAATPYIVYGCFLFLLHKDRGGKEITEDKNNLASVVEYVHVVCGGCGRKYRAKNPKTSKCYICKNCGHRIILRSGGH